MGDKIETPPVEGWYLEGFVDSDSVPRRYTLRRSPLRVGRREDLEIYLPLADVSGLHAELAFEHGRLVVRDLQSSNGTFVNGLRIDGSRGVERGDVIHFASGEFVVGRVDPTPAEHLQTVVMHVPVSALPKRTVAGVNELRQLLRQGAVTVLFQPIVRLADATRASYEILGRGDLPGLTSSPGELFRIAAAIGRQAELSGLFRRRGFAEGARLTDTAGLFVNAHPDEMHSPDLLASLTEIRAAHPDMEVTLEVSEAAITSLESMRRLRAQLRALDMRIAYDDFGAGQARLLEIVEVPPDYLKFDMCLVRDIHRALEPKQKLLRSLVALAQDMGIACLAEGIECREELEYCVAAGFEYGQGYHLGRPAPAATWAAPVEITARR